MPEVSDVPLIHVNQIMWIEPINNGQVSGILYAFHARNIVDFYEVRIHEEVSVFCLLKESFTFELTISSSVDLSTDSFVFIVRGEHEGVPHLNSEFCFDFTSILTFESIVGALDVRFQSQVLQFWETCVKSNRVV